MLAVLRFLDQPGLSGERRPEAGDREPLLDHGPLLGERATAGARLAALDDAG